MPEAMRAVFARLHQQMPRGGKAKPGQVIAPELEAPARAKPKGRGVYRG